MAVYKPPSDAAWQEILLGSEIRAALAAVAEKGKSFAEGQANSFRSEEEHQHYADSFEVHADTVEVDTSHGPSRRAAAVLVNTRPYAAVVEVGNGKYPAHRVLGKTLDFLEVA